MNDAHLAQLARSGFGLTPTSPVVAMTAGNINRGARFDADGSNYVLQELNSTIFDDPDSLMANTMAIVERLHAANMPAIRFVPNIDGGWLVELDGVPWRCYEHIDGVAAHALLTPEEAQSTARIFGRYADAISDAELVEHLPAYHDFDHRVQALEAAVRNDAVGRVAESVSAIDVALRTIDRLRLAPSYEAWSELPRRNAHNDAKAPNCVVGVDGARTIIDLDTTMPGTILADVGELVRSATRALEDRRPATFMAQISSVNRGFLAGFGAELTDAEEAAMLIAGPLLTAENAVRFLTDHLAGDPYYGADAPGHNIERAQEQLALAERLIEAIETAMAI